MAAKLITETGSEYEVIETSFEDSYEGDDGPDGPMIYVYRVWVDEPEAERLERLADRDF
jgi:hypothetical protein